MTLIFSSSLLVPRGKRYLGILWVKATVVSVRLRIYLFALANTNNDTSNTFKVNGQRLKVFLEPQNLEEIDLIKFLQFNDPI